ncbi:MAG: amino acid permease [Mycolicibacterium insubricum]|nr:amino acid permease [Mycobacterium sp.]
MAVNWRIKTVEQSISETDEPGTRLRKDLTWVDLAVFGVSVVVGAGIFTITASTAGNITGPAIIVSFLIAAVTCGLAALCYAEFASTLPVAGSAYTFSYATFGEFVAWIIGWDLILEFAVAAAVVADGWSSYLNTVLGHLCRWAQWPPVGSLTSTFGPVRINWSTLGIIAVVCVLLILGTRLSSMVSAVITAIKVTVVLIVVIVGAFYITPDNYRPFIPPSETGAATGSGMDQSLFSMLTGAAGSHYGLYGVLAGASIVFFAFIGFDVVATTAEETKNPQRDVAKGILTTLGIVTVLYIAVSVVLTGMVSYTSLRTGPNGERANLATAFGYHGVKWAEVVISIGALAGLTTVVMVMVLGQTRVLFAMARDGLLPRWLARTGRRGTPVRITVVIGLLIGALIIVADSLRKMDRLEEMVNVGTLFAFVLVSAGVLVLRRTRPELPRGFRAPWVPWLPIASILACGWLMLNLTGYTWERFGYWMAIGLVIYFCYGRRHSRFAAPEYVTV